jgi:hypothetical protein
MSVEFTAWFPISQSTDSYSFTEKTESCPGLSGIFVYNPLKNIIYLLAAACSHLLSWAVPQQVENAPFSTTVERNATIHSILRYKIVINL